MENVTSGKPETAITEQSKIWANFGEQGRAGANKENGSNQKQIWANKFKHGAK